MRGRPVWITDWQGPVSEGAISRKYNSLGLRMIRDMLKKRPLLYSWGHGGEAEPIVRMLRRMGWLLHPTPFAIKVLDPYRFLRLNESLRLTAERRMLLDGLAVSGLGTLGTSSRSARSGAGPTRSGSAASPPTPRSRCATPRP